MFEFLRRKGAPTDEAAASDQSPAPTVGLRSPVAGTLLPLSQVPDPVFSGGLVGPGFAVDPADGTICAPVAGTVVTLPDSLHAVGIRTDEGAEVLVHVGVDSVTLKGEGFTALVTEGARVTAGQEILQVDLDLLRARIPSVITPVVVTDAAGLTLGEPDLQAQPGGIVLSLQQG